jgi:peptide/nickel transport system substrate-binding protein
VFEGRADHYLKERNVMADSYWQAWAARRLSRRRALKGLAGAGLVIGGAACTSTTETPTPAAPTAAAPLASPTRAAGAAPAAPAVSPTVAAKRGGAFRVAAVSSFPHMDPHQTTNSISLGYGVGLWWSRLLKYDVTKPQPSSVPAPDLAESWDQPDDLTYTFKIRQNVKFQNIPPVNGRAMTMDDILYSLDRIRTPGFPNATTLAAVSKVEAVDRSTLKITLKQPSADFLVNLGFYANAIIAKEVVDQKGDLKEGPAIGTGLFIVDQLDKQGTSTLKRNPDYFISGRPYIDTYSYTNLPDPATLVTAFRSGNIEMMPFGSFAADDMRLLKQANPAFQFPPFRIYTGLDFSMRVDKPPFNDVRVRRAVYKAVDAETIMKTAYGSGWLALGFQLPALDYSLPDAEIAGLYKRDLEGAKKLLADAGFPNGIDVTMVFLASNQQLSGAAELAIAQMKEANIRVTSRVQPDFGAYTEQVVNRADFDMEMGTKGKGSSADGALSTWWHSKGSANFTKINDPQLDQMIERQSTLGRSPDERKKLLQDIQRRVLDQGYFHALFGFEQWVGLQPYVRDMLAAGLTQEPDRYLNVWLDK